MFNPIALRVIGQVYCAFPREAGRRFEKRQMSGLETLDPNMNDEGGCQIAHHNLVFRNPQVNLYVQNVETSARFYRDLFGFSEAFRTPKDGVPIHVELRLGQLTLGVASIESARHLHGLDVSAGSPRAEVVLWVDDVDQAFVALKVKGAKPLSPPHDFIGTMRAAWVADPDGNPVQIVARRSGH